MVVTDFHDYWIAGRGPFSKSYFWETRTNPGSWRHCALVSSINIIGETISYGLERETGDLHYKLTEFYRGMQVIN